MQNSRRLTACVFIFALSACGGGGGSSSSGYISPPPTPATNLSQQSVQRADAQSALTGVQAYEEYAGGGSVSTLSSERSLYALLKEITAPMLQVSHSRRVFTCNGGAGVNETIVETSSTTATVTLEDYYDSACTDLEAEIVWTVTESQSGSQTILSGPATFSKYAQGNSATPTQTASAQITFYENASDQVTGFSYLLSNMTQNGSPISGEAGLACNVASSTSVSCGVAAIANVAALSAEDGALVSASVSTASSVTVSMAVAAYQGAENRLSIAQGTFPNWTISPASDQTASVSITGSATSTGFALTLTDNTNGGTFAISGSSSGNVTGTLTNNSTGATVASFTVNGQGNGTLTYSSGTQVQIVDYVVQG
jgi:hypothetical protein